MKTLWVSSMDDFVEVPIPCDIENYDEDSLRRYFQYELENIGDGFSEALDLACDQPNSTAVLDSVTINHVSIASDSIEIDYCVELSEYQACKDLNGYHSFERTVAGKQFGDNWRFKKYIYVSERSTHDEL